MIAPRTSTVASNCHESLIVINIRALIKKLTIEFCAFTATGSSSLRCLFIIYVPENSTIDSSVSATPMRVSSPSVSGYSRHVSASTAKHTNILTNSDRGVYSRRIQ